MSKKLETIQLLNLLSMAPMLMSENSLRELIAGDLVNKKNISDDLNYIKQGDKAIILIVGMLYNETSLGKYEPYFDMTTYSRIRADYDTALNDPEVKTIYFHFDSGGGQASGCFETCDYIYNNRDKKKTVALVGESCYSGAYALASSCHEIICPPSGGVGSVGVITYHTDYSKYLKDWGVEMTAIIAGSKKDLISPYKPLSEEGKAKLKSHVDICYAQFVSVVARNRNLSEDAVKATEADFYKGEEALKIGFVDKVASIREYFTNPNSSTTKGNQSMSGTQAATIRASEELSSLLGLTKTKEAEQVISTVKTSLLAEMSTKLAEQKTSLEAEFQTQLTSQKASMEAEFQTKLETAIVTAKKEVADATLNTQKAILEACKAAKRPDLAGALIVEGISLQAAQEKIAAQLAAEDFNSPTSTTINSMKENQMNSGVSSAVAQINKNRQQKG